VASRRSFGRGKRGGESTSVTKIPIELDENTEIRREEQLEL